MNSVLQTPSAVSPARITPTTPREATHPPQQQPMQLKAPGAQIGQGTMLMAREVATKQQLARQKPIPAPSQDKPQEKLQEASASQLSSDDVWLRMRKDAEAAAAAHPHLAEQLQLRSAVLEHMTLESALAAHLAHALSSPSLKASILLPLFRYVFLECADVSGAVRRDLGAVAALGREATRKLPSSGVEGECLWVPLPWFLSPNDTSSAPSADLDSLFPPRFCGVQVHRVAHLLWQQGYSELAEDLQRRTGEVCHVDIHPSARIGGGIAIAPSMKVTVGKDARIGDDVIINDRLPCADVALHGRMMGAPDNLALAIGEGAVIEDGVQILGAVKVGREATVVAESVVVEDVPTFATVAGSPATVLRRKAALGTSFIVNHVTW